MTKCTENQQEHNVSNLPVSLLVFLGKSSRVWQKSLVAAQATGMEDVNRALAKAYLEGFLEQGC